MTYASRGGWTLVWSGFATPHNRSPQQVSSRSHHEILHLNNLRLSRSALSPSRDYADANTNHQSIQCLYGRLLQQVSDDAADLEKFIEIRGLLDISIGAKSGRVLNVLCRVRRAEYSNGHLLA